MENRRFLAAITSLIALALMLIPAAAAGQPTTAEATIKQALLDAGLYVDKIKIVPVEGIVIVRGRVPDQESFLRAKDVFQRLSSLRVANLLKVSPVPDDQQIELAAERALHITRTLEGSRLRVHSRDGVVTIVGKVRHELQRDAAVNIVRGVEGVREVQNTIEKM